MTQPLHEGKRGGRFRMTPSGMDRLDVTEEQAQAAQRIALSIYTDMSNNGFALREVLSAIYLSGVSHAISVIHVGIDD